MSYEIAIKDFVLETGLLSCNCFVIWKIFTFYAVRFHNKPNLFPIIYQSRHSAEFIWVDLFHTFATSLFRVTYRR